jgi:DtxR family Mn-dependent transcriptional regulator
MTNVETAKLTGALEDYIETIFLLVRDHGFARVRDIAKARSVKSGSVIPALRRLAEMGLIKYIQREYVGLTDDGEMEARRVLARHGLLARFFSEILQMSPEAADREACAMEHSLSPEGMDRLVRFFEFLSVCPEGHPEWLAKFHGCSRVQDAGGTREHVCPKSGVHSEKQGDVAMSLLDLKPGQEGTVRQVNARGAVRQRLLDMGLLPNAVARMERVAPTGDPVWIRLEGSQIALRRKEAASVLIIKR